MKIAFNPSTVAALTTPPNNKDITFDLRGRNIFARGVKFLGTDTWRDIKINNVSIDSNILDLRNGSNTTLTNTNGVVTINSTWRPVVDNLTSDSTTSSLSAKQGKVLKSLIDGKSNSGHTHDDRYLKLTGGTMASNALITFADSGSWGTNKGPQGARGGLYWTGQSDYAKLYAEETAGDNLDLVIQFGDDNSNGLSIRNKANTQTSYISAGGVITTGTFKGNLDWSYITNKPSSYTPSAHTHAWNSLTHSSTTENQAILTNGKVNGWKLYTLNISRWDNAANNAHSHSNKSVLDGITSALVNNWNTAFTFVNTITGTDTDKVINKWDEIVNFLAGITEDNKLNTLLNSKLSVYELANNTNIGTIKNNGIYYSTTDASSGTLTNSPFNTGFALINMTSYDGGDDLRRSRLAFNAYGEIKVSDDRDYANTAETWYNVLTSKNSGISGSTIKLNGTSITVYSSDTADGRYVKKTGDTMSGALNFANNTWNKVGDDSYVGDCNVSGHFGIRAANTTYPGIAFFNNSGAHLGNLTAYNGNIKYGAYSLRFLDNGNTSVGASTWTNPFSSYNSNAVADGQAICVWGQSSSLSNLAADSGDMSLWLKRVNAKAATLNMVLDGEYYANGNLRLAHVSEIPTSLKNPYALTISLNGTSQGPYDGSAAKNINITPSSIGAATSGHNHDGRYVYNYGGTQMDGASINKNALGMATNSGITGDWWHILQAAWNGEYRWNSLIAFPTLNRNGMYYRSGLDDNTKWGSWVKLLDVNNYSSTLDSRYYTESESDSRFVNITGDTMTGTLTLANSSVNSGTDTTELFRIYSSTGYKNGLSIFSIDNKTYINAKPYGSGITNALYLRTYNLGAVNALILTANGNATFIGSVTASSFIGNASTATKLTSSAGNATLPIYFSDGKPVACTASLIFSNLSNSGNNLSITVAGQNRTLTVAYANSAGSVSNLTVHLYLSDTDTTWWPLIWGGSSHNNTSDSTGTVYKSYDKLSWQTSSLTLYATNIQTENIKNLSVGGGIYWNPYVESTTDGSDTASITLVRLGVAGGTTLVLSLMNDTNDTILFKTNGSARLYHNSYPILTTLNTYVSNNKGYINGTEITLVNNADKVDNRHAISTTPNTGIIYKAAIYTSSSLTSYWVRLASIPSISLNAEFVATIHVLSGHSNPGRSAILLVYLRGSASSFMSKSFKICCNSNYDPNRFRLYYKDSDKTSEIWYQTTGLWDGIITTVISLSSEGSLYEGLTLYSGSITAVQTPSMSTYLSALVSTITDNISGNASTATKLLNARLINGTNFDGSANITTSYWGTTRTLTIGNSGKSVNGSANISWSLSEIGAASSSHTHTVFKNNLMIKGTNGVSDSASIHLGIGDSDTGFKWISDGKCLIYANNTAVGEWASGGMNWFKNPTVNGNKVWNAGNDGSGSGLDADTLDGYHENSFLCYRGTTSTDLEATLWNLIGIKTYHNALPDGLTSVYNYGSVISLPGNGSRFEIYASHYSSDGSGLYYRSGWNSDKKSWLKFIDSSNIGSQTVASATKLQTARKIWGLNFDGTKDINGLLTHIISSDDLFLNVHDNRTTSGFLAIRYFRNNSGVAALHWFHDKYGGYDWNNNCLNLDPYAGGCVTLGRWDNPDLTVIRGGNIGISTTSPSYKLHVNGTLGVIGTITTLEDVSIKNTTAVLKLFKVINNLSELWMGVNSRGETFLWTPSNASLILGTNNSHRLDILENGNVGIGITSPTYKLHVAGDIYTTTGFKKNGSSDSYVLLGGGGHKLESSLNVASAGVASKVYGQVGDTGSHELVRCDMNNDQFRIIAGSNGNNNGWAEIATADDGNEPIYVRQYTGVFSSVKRTLTLLDANGYTHFPSYINIGGNENNNSSPDRVWGSNGSDSYLRSYRTSALRVSYASSAGNSNTISGYDINHLLVKRGRLGDYNIDHETTFGTRDIQPSSEITISGKKPFDGWGTLLVIGSLDGASNQQLAFTGDNRMYIRCAYGTSNNYNTKDWATVALTSDNVASATKLQTTRTLWGQPFNGTANVDNTLRIRQTTGNYCEGIRIQTADSTWATIILGATGDSGTNANAWSIHRKSDNNFAISRNSSDGVNGLVMTSTGMGLGTTAPTLRLDVHGNIRATGQIIREGSSLTWVNGRRGALLRETTSTGYHTLWSLKTTNGSWDFGEYNSSGWNNIPVLSYITDTNFNSGNNTTTYQIKFPLDSGTIALTKNIPTSLKNPYALTLKANGTTLAVYDGSSAKEANFTYANVGAASASHTHTYIVAEDLRSKYPGLILDPQRMKLSFLAASTLGIKDGSYYDVITVRSYADSSGGSDNALLFSKNTNSLYHTRFAFGSTSSWGSPLLIIDSGNIGSLSVAYASKAGSVAWDSITGKPSSFTPSSHTHSWTSITDKLVAGNEFNIVNAGFKEGMWFNYLPINDRSKTATITGYHFGNGATGYTSINASGFIKKGSNSNYVLLGDGGHKTISSLSVNYANSAGNADTVDRYHANTIYNAPSFTVNNSNTSNTYILLATITISGTSLGCAEFTTLFQNRECLDSSSFILSGGIRRNSTTSVTATLSYITLHTKTPRNIYLRSDDGVTFLVYIQSAAGNWTTYYRAIPIVDSGNITYSNTGTTSPISGSVLNITATKGGNVNYASSAGNADTLDSYHANGLLTALSNSNNGISITVGGTTKSVSNISVNYASSAGSATKVIVNLHTANDTNYPLVWSNLANSSTVTENQLYKSWSDLYYNPKNKRLTVGGSVVASSFVKSGGTSLQLLRADGGIATFNWSGQSGLPTWLWGGNNLHSYYVYNPSNFRVAYATSSGNADTLDGVHLSGIFTAFGNNNHNITATIGGVTKEFLVNYASDADKLDGYHASSGNDKPWGTIPAITTSGWMDIGKHLEFHYDNTTGSDYSTILRCTGNYSNIVNLPSASGTLALTSDIPTVTNCYWANVKISTSSSTTTSPTVHTLTATRVCVGYNPEIDNSISCSNWFRSSGATGWYNATYLGGWYMSDTSWVRTHNGVGIYTSGQIYSPSSIRMGNIYLLNTNEINSASGIHLNYQNSGNISLCVGGGNVGIGTISPSYKLDVNGNIHSSGTINCNALNVGSTLSIKDSVISCSASDISIESKESGKLLINSREVLSYNSDFIHMTNKLNLLHGLCLLASILSITYSTYTTDDVTVLIGVLRDSSSFKFRPAMNGLLLFLKIGKLYSNTYFWCTAENCVVVRAKDFGVYLDKDQNKDCFGDGLARMFIYIDASNRWYEFYCG